MAASKKALRTRRSDTDARTTMIADALDGIRQLVGALGATARGIERDTGMTNAQLFVLRQVSGQPGMTISDLASRVLTQQSAVSQLVRRLETAGLLARERSSDDRRFVRVFVTPSGQHLVSRAPEAPLARTLRALECLSDPQLDTLRRSLRSLLSQMGGKVSAAPTRAQ